MVMAGTKAFCKDIRKRCTRATLTFCGSYPEIYVIWRCKPHSPHPHSIPPCCHHLPPHSLPASLPPSVPPRQVGAAVHPVFSRGVPGLQHLLPPHDRQQSMRYVYAWMVANDKCDRVGARDNVGLFNYLNNCSICLHGGLGGVCRLGIYIVYV